MKSWRSGHVHRRAAKRADVVVFGRVEGSRSLFDLLADVGQSGVQLQGRAVVSLHDSCVFDLRRTVPRIVRSVGLRPNSVDQSPDVTEMYVEIGRAQV